MSSSTAVSFPEATRVQRLDSHTYRVHLSKAYCIGAVPNGGYTASCMLAAAREHLSARGQPDTLTAHFEYPSRTSAGPAVVVVEDVKLGPAISRLHLTLWQGGHEDGSWLLDAAPWVDGARARRTILAYTTHADLRSWEGVSMPVGWESSPAARMPPVPADMGALARDKADGEWELLLTPPGAGRFMASLTRWEFYVQRSGAGGDGSGSGSGAGPVVEGSVDMWYRLASGERITQGMLAYLNDSFPFNLHLLLAPPELRQMLEASSAAAAADDDDDDESKSKSKKTKDGEDDGETPDRAKLWYPTLVMNLEAKAPLPEEGVEWLAVRVTCKQVRDGRFDTEVMVRDVEGEIVALSNHVALIVDMGKNMGVKASL